MHNKLQLSASEFSGDGQSLPFLPVCLQKLCVWVLFSPWKVWLSVIPMAAGVPFVGDEGWSVDGGLWRTDTWDSIPAESLTAILSNPPESCIPPPLTWAHGLLGNMGFK